MFCFCFRFRFCPISVPNARHCFQVREVRIEEEKVQGTILIKARREALRVGLGVSEDAMEAFRQEFQHGQPVVLPSGTVVMCIPSAQDLVVQAARGCVGVAIGGPLARSFELAKTEAARVEAKAEAKKALRLENHCTLKSDHTDTKYGGDMTGGILAGLKLVAFGQKKQFGEKMAKVEAKQKKARGLLRKAHEKTMCDDGEDKSAHKLNKENMKAIINSVITIQGEKSTASKGWGKSAASVSVEFEEQLKQCGADSAMGLPWDMMFHTLGGKSYDTEDEDDEDYEASGRDCDFGRGARADTAAELDGDGGASDNDESLASLSDDDEENDDEGESLSDDEVDCTTDRKFKKRLIPEVPAAEAAQGATRGGKMAKRGKMGASGGTGLAVCADPVPVVAPVAAEPTTGACKRPADEPHDATPPECRAEGGKVLVTEGRAKRSCKSMFQKP